MFFFFFFKQKTAYEMLRSLVGSEMCIRDRYISSSSSFHSFVVAAWETKCWSRSSYSGDAADGGGNALPPQLLASSSSSVESKALLLFVVVVVVVGISKWEVSSVCIFDSFTTVPVKSGEGMPSSLSSWDIIMEDRRGLAEDDCVEPVATMA
eukprot:TRINITY_DN17600_c0_g1_i2.p1 TRINITY_DN17600_c0_g1~~TRINITY_DN17600_c0_g1_i2.p1  ORF type:complete len:152 (-),score=46.86 TRINITY_DN17600_c0_g1_i2:18-473(-)